MRAALRPVAPLVLSLTLLGSLAACSQGDPSGGTPAATEGDTALASSSIPAGSSGTGPSGAGSSGTGSLGSADGGVTVGPDEPQPARGTVDVVRELPHDPSLFTQGLQVVDDQIYESTGQYGQSQVQRRPLAGGEPTVSVPMADDEFGEGLAVTDDTVWTLTWRKQIAHDRDPQTLEVRSEVPYEGEGWGLCHDGARLVMSDGSDTLTFRDPATFEPTGTIAVTAGGTPVQRLNELECVNGAVLANVWMTDEIVRIDPATGAVTAIYDASALQQPRPANPDAVLNGIAALPGSENVLLTGKLWPTMYEVRLVG